MQKLLLLLLAAIFLTWKLSSGARETTPVPSVPPHTLFVPQEYHVGEVETVLFTSYSPEEFPVTAVLSWRGCNREEGVLHRATATARLGRPLTLAIQMPSLNQLKDRSFFINITSHRNAITYLRHTKIYFSSTSFGFLLIKTDKPIYKPSQDVKFCLALVTKSLKPHAGNTTVEVTVRDSKFKQVMKWESVVIPSGDLLCLEFPLDEEPNLGAWRVSANVKQFRHTRNCRIYYSLPTSTCSFKVEEFVLPKFEVKLSAPGQIQRDDDAIRGLVEAKYLFGGNVQGTVKINATLTSSRRKETLLFYERTAHLTANGVYSFEIDTNHYHRQVRYRYDPFCTKSKILITAEVQEEGRGTKFSDSASIPLVYTPVDLEFASDNPKHFKPGLDYLVKAVAKLGDGSPASGMGVKVVASVNNGKQLLHDAIITSEVGTGHVTATIAVPKHAKCLKITLTPDTNSTSCSSEEKECFSPSPLYSPTNSFLQLQEITNKPLQPGASVNIQATATTPFSHLHILVISQGSIQGHSYQSERASTSTSVSFSLSFATTPNVKILGIFAREDGELVADLIELDVACQLAHEVDVAFNASTVEPGDPVSITTTASPHSVVLLSVFDKSLTLLAEACKSLEKSNVCRLLRQLTHGRLNGGETCTDKSAEDTCCPSSCKEPRLYGVNDILTAAGVTLRSNMFRPTPPAPPPPPFVPRPLYPFVSLPGLEGPPILTRVTISTTDSGDKAKESGEEEEKEEARTFFPESWLFTLQKTNKIGRARIDSEAPDTITTWNAEAIALSKTTGLGISSRLAQLTVAKSFFASLELPFSINFGETVTLTPLLFFFSTDRSNITATVTVEVDDDLSIVENSLMESAGQLIVVQGRSKPFTLRVKPRAIGQLSVTVSAVGDGGERDTVKKLLFVKPGCEKFEVMENLFAEGTGRHCFNYTLPSCVIPGSPNAVISATGDVMPSSLNLNRLLVLPSGCGEQNLVKTAVNWVVAEYLQATDQLQDFIGVKVKNNVQKGYQRELTFLQGSGCFAVWSSAPCSLWLTAAVVNVFSGIVQFYKEYEPGTQIIDTAVVNGALNYVIRNQRSSGKLPIIGRIHNYRLMRRQDPFLVAHTAFGLLAFKQHTVAFGTNSNLRRAIARAETHLARAFTRRRGQFCNYDVVLTSYALQKATPTPNGVIRELLFELRSRIVNSRAFPGACFICQECPGDRRRSTSSATNCKGRPIGEGSASCVETTAYALLSLLEAGDRRHTVCLARWLVKIRGNRGGYYSSQDTIVALLALSEFGNRTFTEELNKSVTFAIPGLTSGSDLRISKENRSKQIEKQVPNVPSSNNCVTWSGPGTVIIQSILTYHGCNCCHETRSFSLELATELQDTPVGMTLDVSITIQYLLDNTSNMAIVDVETASGYAFTDWRFKSEFRDNADLERVERKGSNVIFYFNEVKHTSTTFIVKFIKIFPVEDPQQLPVSIYDYYDPGQTVTKYYLPVTSPSPPPSHTSGPTPPNLPLLSTTIGIPSSLPPPPLPRPLPPPPLPRRPFPPSE